MWEEMFDAKKQRLFTWMYQMARLSALEFVNAVPFEEKIYSTENGNGPLKSDEFKTEGNDFFGLEHKERTALDLI